MRIVMIVTAALLLAFAGTASANQPKAPQPVFGKKAQPGDFPELIKMIRIELEPGGRFADVPPGDRPLLDEKLKLMETLLGDVRHVDELSDNDKMKLLNAQSHVNAVLLKNDDQRLVCERYTPTGSHRPQKVCITVAQRRENSERARRQLESNQRIMLMPKN
jgi:hypothetical protein